MGIGTTGYAGQTGRRGRILRFKRGYNPNSSSMGSEVAAFYALPVALLLLPIIFGAATAAISGAAMGRRSKDNDGESGDSDGPDESSRQT